MKYLFKNALEIGALVLPEFNLYEGRGVVAVQQGLCGVSVQDISQLPYPLDHHRLDGVDQLVFIRTPSGHSNVRQLRLNTIICEAGYSETSSRLVKSFLDLFVGFNKLYFKCNNTLATEQSGRAKSKITYISTFCSQDVFVAFVI